MFYELGICEAGAGGATEITWKEMQAWSELTNTPLQLWEAQTLKEMSATYVREYHAATDKNRPPPYSDHRTLAYMKKMSDARVKARRMERQTE